MKKVANLSVIVPSLNHGNYLDKCLRSIFEDQNYNYQVFLMDGGSNDNTIEIIENWREKLHFFRSLKDNGQGAAINEAAQKINTKYLCWLNSDDYFLPNGLDFMYETIQERDSPVLYCRTYDLIQKNLSFRQTKVENFSKERLAIRCIISQPGSIIKKDCWDKVNGLDQNLKLAFDYDLWWKIFMKYGDLHFIDKFVAVNRVHFKTKTVINRKKHYEEAIKIIKKYNKRVPIKWYLYQPYAVWLRLLLKI
jgi:glycosyltransferase involved in cell wall biosynthesis